MMEPRSLESNACPAKIAQWPLLPIGTFLEIPERPGEDDEAFGIGPECWFQVVISKLDAGSAADVGRDRDPQPAIRRSGRNRPHSFKEAPRPSRHLDCATRSATGENQGRVRSCDQRPGGRERTTMA